MKKRIERQRRDQRQNIQVDKAGFQFFNVYFPSLYKLTLECGCFPLVNYVALDEFLVKYINTQ